MDTAGQTERHTPAADHVGVTRHARFSAPRRELLLGVDAGTTHLKAGLFGVDGTLLALAQRPTPTVADAVGAVVYGREQLWAAAGEVIREVALGAEGRIAGVGVASMAETGLLVDRRTGAGLTELLPWHDRRPTPFAAQIDHAGDRFERFCRSGQLPSFKSALAKLLWLRAQAPLPHNAVWLSTADFLVARLTGQYATEPSLATRTGAFRLDTRAWDAEWLRDWELDPALLPPVVPAGAVVGTVAAGLADELGLPAGTPVVLAGHDHVCGAFAAGAIEPGQVFDSMGTAETLVGALPARPLGRADYAAGLGIGCHVVPDRLYWMGGLSASGGSVEWLRGLLGAALLSYADLAELVEAAGSEPTGLLYLPYLLGSGTPHADGSVRGAIVGLGAEHSRAHLAKAVLEGTAYELEFIRQSAERSVGQPIRSVVAAGGATRNRAWLQIKADVGGCAVQVPACPEATLLGAALLAGVGAGLYQAAADALRQVAGAPAATYHPDAERHRRYRLLFAEGYLPLQQPLRQIAARLNATGALTA